MKANSESSRPPRYTADTERAWLASIVASCPDAIIAEDLEGIVTSWNEGATRLFGYLPTEMIGHPLDRLYPLEHLAEIETLRARARVGITTRQDHAVRLTKSGRRVEVTITKAPVRDASGGIVGVSIFASDISERVRAERALRESERQFRDLAVSLPHMVWTCDRDGRCDYLSPQWTAYTGLPETPQLGYGWTAQVHPADIEQTQVRWEAAVRTGGLFDTEFRIRRHDGAYRWFKTRAAPIRDESGQIVKWFGSNTDIQEIRDTEAALRMATEELEARVLARTEEIRAGNNALAAVTRQLERAQRIARVGSWSIELASGAVTWSAGMYAVMGYEPHERIPSFLEHASLFPEDWPQIEQTIAQTRSTGQQFELRLQLVRRDGGRRIAIVRGEGTRDSNGSISGIAGSFQDVTEQEAVRAELSELNRLLSIRTEQAELANSAKSMFLANMSHEIRTPIAAITGVTYLLGRSRLSPDQRDLVRTVEKSSKTLMRMINDILDLSKIEAGQMTLDCAPFQLSAVVDEIAGLMSGYGATKELELILDLDPTLPESLVGDQVRLTQVLTNLVGNALKFTESGFVRLSARREGSTDGRACLRFEVEDSGPGISPEALSKLFSPFVQGDPANARRVGGTGLGLAIVKELVTIMGGEVGGSSALGRGSCFWIAIPFPVSERPELPVASRPTKVLIVDDNPAQRAALLATARALGWQAQAASSTDEAWTRVLDRARIGQPYDALVLDWRMQGVDGGQLLTALRHELGAGIQLPAVATATAKDASDLRESGSSYLVNAIIAKPVTPTALREAVVGVTTGANHLESAGAPEPQGRAAELPATPLEGVTLLIVDDSEVNRVIAGRILEANGAKVATAGGGREAVALVRANPGRYDAILMDLQMPDMDGLEATRQIRLLGSAAKLPIIALTANALDSERARALKAGMTDFLTKPFAAEDLAGAIRRHVDKRGARFASGGGEGAQPWPSIEGIDAAEVRLRLGGDVGLYWRLLGLFGAEIDDMQAALTSSADPTQFPSLAQRAHKLRGGAGTLGGRTLSSAAGDLETHLRTGDSQRLPASILRLSSEMARLRRSISIASEDAADKGRGPTGEAAT